MRSNIRLFEDDTYHSVHSTIKQSDAVTLQDYKRRLEVWEGKWCMEFHVGVDYIQEAQTAKYEYNLHRTVLHMSLWQSTWV